jgi:predicted nuclease of predicted toxin-antitoxin system
MTLRFFADHCVSNFVIETLRNEGHEVFRLRDHLPTDSPDSTVIVKAQELESILISLNGDFADIVSYPPEHYKGIIALQVRNHPEIIPQVMTRLTAYLSTHPNMNHYEGRLFLVEVHRIRVRV